MRKSTIHLLVWFVGVVATFLLLGQFSISVGDDLGYMFADSKLHNCDGPMISSVWECFTTQAKHYVSTNGRFIVHVITHFFTALAGMKVFNVVNALMFGLLWLLVVKTIGLKKASNKTFLYLLSLFLLWTCLPLPGATMLSLVAFATNYLWTGVAYLAFLMLLRKMSVARKTFRQNWILYIACGVAAIVVGSLQESYALPISGALFVLGVFNIRRINSLLMTMIIGFFVGVGVSMFAPGNWNRMSSGGGFSIEKLLRTCNILSQELIFSVIALLVLMTVAFFVINRKSAKQFVKRNAFYYLAISFSLFLALLTYSALRQMFCPFLLSVIVIGRMLMRCENIVRFRQVSMAVMGCVLVAIFAGGYVLRENTYNIHQNILNQLGGNPKNLIADATNAHYNIDNKFIRGFAKRYAPDPLAGEELHIVFDGYTKRGLSRIGWENRQSSNVISVIPYPQSKIEQCFENPPEVNQIGTTTSYKAKVINIDRKYRSVRLDTAINMAGQYMPFETESSKKALRHERYVYNGHVYFILDSRSPDIVVLK